jgi:hypothetical protein
MQTEHLKKTTITSFIVTLLTLTLLIATIPFATADVPSAVMYAPPLTVPVTVDGVWSSGEWADAPQYTMANSTGGNVGYIRVKFNSSHLLVLIDSPWDTTPSSVYYHENVWLAFDTLNNGGTAPQTDDYLVHSSTSWFPSVSWVGNGTAWNQSILINGVSCVQAGDNFGGGVPLGTSPNSATPHRISEMAVPLGYIAPTFLMVGFYAQVDDDSTDPDGEGDLPSTSYSEWSPGAGGSPGWPGGWGSAPCPAPNAWGKLILGVVYAPRLTVPVTVDGVWSSGEWADAPQYTMANSTGGNVGYIRVKFNSSHLLVLIDSPWDTTPSSVYYHENVWLAFDTLNNGGTAPQTDDYLVHSSTSWFPSVSWVGNGTAWNQSILINGVSCVQAGDNFGGGVPLGTSPNSATPHRISEMAVPLAYVGSAGSTVGFYAQVDDDSTDPDGEGDLPSTSYSEWPLAAGGSPGWPGAWGSAPCPAPNAWGKLRLAELGMPLWDVDGNKIVDIVDIVIVALAFGSKPGDDKWDSRADIALEFGLVDIVDIVTVALRFGATY